ncbi:hypothetical protein DVA67_025405 [Solirubrobacter sp. CPCC 204708]|uniref:NERD domain-containing protein n=1 Tax=Solirubrobacter deserti TaxID=2282478 RepID=A0ABT4RUP1_9ACTN|nr:hypothetical protein [Solirubrobacter deserti]MBE2319339.1 hypothetical protein [Solirubrobacter deserti]MDA0142299.1 hypothetical protein [Solirubrobacter deserti]
MLLPPHTPLLRRGLGIGTRRAYTATFGRIQTFDAPSRRPERDSQELRRFPLPNGAEGVLAHHTHLGEAPGESVGWAAWTHTVVYAELPAANRVIGRASLGRREPVKAMGTLTLKRRDPVPVAPGADLSLSHLVPDGIEVELEHGALCVWTKGRVTDPAAMETLCQTALDVAEAIQAEVMRQPQLEAETAVAPPPRSEWRQWVEAGAARVRWTTPPADVDSAVAAYAPLVRSRARRFGVISGLLFFVVAAVLTAAALYVGVRTELAAGGAITAAFAAWALWRIARAAVGTARELSAAERDARARPWGLEAFVQGYAASRGLAVEDPAQVQRRFDCPVRGRAVAALHGADGHVLLWRDVNGDRWIVRVTAAGVYAEPGEWSAAAIDASRRSRNARSAALPTRASALV